MTVKSRSGWVGTSIVTVIPSAAAVAAASGESAVHQESGFNVEDATTIGDSAVAALSDNKVE